MVRPVVFEFESEADPGELAWGWREGVMGGRSALANWVRGDLELRRPPPGQDLFDGLGSPALVESAVVVPMSRLTGPGESVVGISLHLYEGERGRVLGRTLGLTPSSRRWLPIRDRLFRRGIHGLRLADPRLRETGLA